MQTENPADHQAKGAGKGKGDGAGAGKGSAANGGRGKGGKGQGNGSGAGAGKGNGKGKGKGGGRGANQPAPLRLSLLSISLAGSERQRRRPCREAVRLRTTAARLNCGVGDGSGRDLPSMYVTATTFSSLHSRARLAFATCVTLITHLRSTRAMPRRVRSVTLFGP